MKKAFTMLELTFVIVIIGILSSIAIPKLAVTRDDAEVSKGRSAVAALRSALAMERQKKILKGDFDDVTGTELLTLIEYGLGSKWVISGTDDNKFTFTGPDGTCEFNVVANRFIKKKDTCGVAGMSDL